MKWLKCALPIALLSLLLGSCSMTSSGNTKRNYEDLVRVDARDFATVTITADFGAISAATEQESGDASSEMSPTVSAGWNQGQASAASEGVSTIRDIANWLKQWAEQNDNSVTEVPQPPPVIQPEPPPVVPDEGDDIDKDEPNKDDLDTMSLDGYNIIKTISCEGTMSFRADGETKSTNQVKCVFEGFFGPDFGQSYLVVWSDGNKLWVPDSSHMVMEGASGGYRKFQPGGTYSYTPPNPDIPFMEVYAARGTSPNSVSILAPKE